MKYEFFIARRLSFSKHKSFAKLIIRIAIASVALSLAVMIVTQATITGFKNQITEKIFGFWGHIQIKDIGMARSNFDPLPILSDRSYIDSIRNLDFVEIKPLDEATKKLAKGAEFLQSKAGVKSIQSFVFAPGILDTRDNFEPIMIKGVGQDFDWENMKQFILKGEALEYNPSEISEDIVISLQTSNRLGLEIGDAFIAVFLKGKSQLKRRFRVKGIYKTGLEEYDKRFALTDIRRIQRVLGWEENQVAGFEVFIDDIADLEIIQQYLYYDVLPSGIDSETIKTIFPSIFDWLSLQDINEEIIYALMVIVSLINMLTCVLILILERTKMIGILKSLGAKNWNIRLIFLALAGHIILWGLLIGNVLGFAFCLFQKYTGFIKLNEENYYLSVVPIEFNFTAILFLNVIIALIILVFMIIPSYLVTKIDPVKVLRFS